MLSYSFSKQKRLLTTDKFQTVFSSKTKISLSNDAMVVYVLADTQPRLGLVIANRYIKTAVQRNTIKRILRESFRLNFSILPNAAIIIVARTALIKLTKPQLRGQIEIIWQQLRKRFPALLATV